MALPGGAQLINTHEDLLTAFTNIDQRLHRIIGGNDPPYIYRNKLYLPCSMYSIALGAIGNAGERNAMTDTLGAAPVSDATARTTLSANNTHLGRISGSAGAVMNPTFGSIDETTTDPIKRLTHRRLFETVLTATAGGEITSAPIGGAALAGYQLCVCITHIWSDQTDAGIAMDFAATSGIDVGPATWSWATTANLVTDYSPGVWYQCTADNEVLNVSCGAGLAQANQVIHAMGTFHYET